MSSVSSGSINIAENFEEKYKLSYNSWQQTPQPSSLDLSDGSFTKGFM